MVSGRRTTLIAVATRRWLLDHEGHNLLGRALCRQLVCAVVPQTLQPGPRPYRTIEGAWCGMTCFLSRARSAAEEATARDDRLLRCAACAARRNIYLPAC